MQTELFDNSLTDRQKEVVVASMKELSVWGVEETSPHMRAAILEYFNQLKQLIEADNGELFSYRREIQ
jgi:hypothetical protein